MSSPIFFFCCLVLLFLGQANSMLSTEFYDTSFPEAETIISSAMSQAFKRDPTLAASQVHQWLKKQLLMEINCAWVLKKTKI
ncbi:hypothetical protein FRX31_007752 [Thalictrum thalictroides]|uniref:Uncharacterized protein n=1 Tax=Thalictrum thalictroides TaxID=46969 RepID=A0A7J6WYY3_THATH|nr:hypothetical protein FRX31_007752 [Thalictrum thalictroides]